MSRLVLVIVGGKLDRQDVQTQERLAALRAILHGKEQHRCRQRESQRKLHEAERLEGNRAGTSNLEQYLLIP